MASAEDLLVVPVRTASGGTFAVRTARLAGEGRVGIAFTSESRLREVLGGDQAWVRLHERALRQLLRPLGVARIQVDPELMLPRIPADPAGVAAPQVSRTEARRPAGAHADARSGSRDEPARVGAGAPMRLTVGAAAGSSAARHE